MGSQRGVEGGKQMMEGGQDEREKMIWGGDGAKSREGKSEERMER